MTPVCLTPDEQRLLELCNQARRLRELPELKAASGLVLAAREHANEMLEKCFYARASYDGTTAFRRVRLHYPCSAHAESIARDHPTPVAALGYWMKSPSDRQNVLDPFFSVAGFGVAGTSRKFWCADFARR